MISILRYRGDKYITKALAYKYEKSWDKMLENLDKSYHVFFYDIDNTSTPIMWYYGIAYFNKGETDKAFLSFKKAYEINPNHMHVINNLATSYGLKGEYYKAKELYKRCNKISPRFEDGALNLSAIYNSKEEYEKSMDVLLAIRDFKVDDWGNLSNNYIKYFKTTLNNISQQKLGKSYIFEKNKILFFNQTKEINRLRKKGYSYTYILNKNH